MLTIHSEKKKSPNESSFCSPYCRQVSSTVRRARVITAEELRPVHPIDISLASCAYQALRGLYKNGENIFGALVIITGVWFYVSRNHMREVIAT